jgi:RNA polymerase sigma-70 factor (ECF subfamily)
MMSMLKMEETPSVSESDESLVQQIDALYRHRLKSYFREKIGAKADVEDLTQEVFARFISSSRVQAARDIGPFIFKIAENLLRDRFRRQRSHSSAAHESVENYLEALAELPSSLVETRSPIRILMGRKALMTAVDALNELTERTRHIFVLHRLEKMRHKEIANLFGITTSAVEKHIAKATAHLARRIGQLP